MVIHIVRQKITFPLKNHTKTITKTHGITTCLPLRRELIYHVIILHSCLPWFETSPLQVCGLWSNLRRFRPVSLLRTKKMSNHIPALCVRGHHLILISSVIIINTGNWSMRNYIIIFTESLLKFVFSFFFSKIEGTSLGSILAFSPSNGIMAWKKL